MFAVTSTVTGSPLIVAPVDRHALGQLQSPDDLGDALLEARPDLPWVVVAVQRMSLDAKTARMTSTREQYRFEREQGKGDPPG